MTNWRHSAASPPCGSLVCARFIQLDSALGDLLGLVSSRTVVQVAGPVASRRSGVERPCCAASTRSWHWIAAAQTLCKPVGSAIQRVGSPPPRRRSQLIGDQLTGCQRGCYSSKPTQGRGGQVRRVWGFFREQTPCRRKADSHLRSRSCERVCRVLPNGPGTTSWVPY